MTGAATPSRGPLAGLRVIELAGLGPGPFACMLLAELGAEVVRIDRPGTAPASPGTDLLNRGKRSVMLDLKVPAAVEAVLALTARADAFVEAFRPGVAERLGLGPEPTMTGNPKLVYARMTGWGQDGPLAHTAGHDIDYIAVTGALHAIGGASPRIPLNLLGDFGGGATYLVIGILAALREAEQTGHGQIVDAAIVDGTAHLLAAVHAMLAAGRWTDRRDSNLLDGAAPFYSVYETADHGFMAVGALEPKFYRELLRLLELEDTVDAGAQYDREQWPSLRAKLAAAFRSRSREEWTKLFAAADACVAPVLSLTEAADNEHVRHRSSIVRRDGVLQPGPAPRLSSHLRHEARPAPVPGEHTYAVLFEAGLAAEELIVSGAAVQTGGPGDPLPSAP